MRYEEKTKRQLIDELGDLRRRLAAEMDASPTGERKRDEEVLRERELGFRSLFQKDITERKRAEQVLQKAHDELERRIGERTAELHKANEELAMFRRFAEASSQGFSMADRDGNLTYLNPALCQMLGEERPEDRIGQHLSIYYSQESNRRGKEEIEPALKRNGHWEGELPMLSCQGTSIPTWHSTFVIRDEKGVPLRIAVVITDISERKRAEAVLRQSHEELRAIYDGMGDGLVIVDIATTTPVRVNAALCQLLGYPEEELMHLTGPQMHPAEELPKIWAHFQAAVQGCASKYEAMPFLRKDGEIVYADVVGKRILYNGRPCLINFFHDVTGRKRAEQALRASEERFRVAFEEAPVGIVIAVGGAVFARANSAFCQMSGYTEEELTGMSIHDLTHPEDRKRSVELSEQVLTGEIPKFTMEKRYLRKGGGYFWAQTTATAVHDQEKNMIFALGIVENINERKQAEEALAKEHRNLKHLLQSSDHERQLIAYEIHDGLAQQLAGALIQFETFAHRKNTQPQQAEDAFHAGLTMLRQSHFEARRLIAGVRPPILDESGVVSAIAHLVHEPVRGTRQQIDFHSRVQFDRLVATLENAIYRIVQEGLTNACQHSKSEKVRVSLLQREARVRIEIRDWGTGFDVKAVQKNRFGLEGIRQRARLLGGKCSIRSKPGKGTTITVELPVVAKD